MAIFLRDWFNLGLGQWTTTGGVSIVTANSEQRMKVNSTANSAESAWASINPTSNELIVEFDLFRSGDAGFVGDVELQDSAGAKVCGFKVQANGDLIISTDNGSTFTQTAVWSANTYYQLHFAVDKINKTCRFYLSNAAGQASSSWYWLNSATYGFLGTIARFCFKTSTTGFLYASFVHAFSPNYFVIGDSIGNGENQWSAHPNNRTGGGYDITRGNAYQLEQLLGAGVEYVCDRAWNGSNSTHINTDIDALVIKQYAKKVIVHVGHNDFYSGLNTLATAKSNINSIITKLNNAGISGANITFCKIPPSLLFEGTPAGDEQNRIDFNAWLEDRCAQLGMRIAFNNERLNDNTILTQYKRLQAQYDNGDGVHYTALGQAELAKTMGQAKAPGGVLRPATTNRVYPASYLDNPQGISSSSSSSSFSSSSSCSSSSSFSSSSSSSSSFSSSSSSSSSSSFSSSSSSSFSSSSSSSSFSSSSSSSSFSSSSSSSSSFSSSSSLSFSSSSSSSSSLSSSSSSSFSSSSSSSQSSSSSSLSSSSSSSLSSSSSSSVSSSISSSSSSSSFSSSSSSSSASGAAVADSTMQTFTMYTVSSVLVSDTVVVIFVKDTTIPTF